MAKYQQMKEETVSDVTQAIINEAMGEPPVPWNTDEWSENMWDASSVHIKGKPLDEQGREVLDPIPLEPPLGYKRMPSLAEQIRAQVELHKRLAENEMEDGDTFEEADDFDVGDDYDPTSPYEANFDPMSDQDKAALASRGRDVEGSLTPEQKENLARATSPRSVTKPAQPAKSAEPNVAGTTED